MSQKTLLEEVEQWNPDMCKNELRTVLPKLVSIHCRTESWTEHTRILRIIMDMFLPHLRLSELEEECFSKVLPKVVKVFDNLMEEISGQVSGLSSQNPELTATLRNSLQVMIETLEAVAVCVRHVCNLEGACRLSEVRSVPSCVLYLLKNTFQHCKESEGVYNGRLSLVGDLLQALFKEAYTLQKGLIELLDRVSLDDDASKEEVSDIVTVIHNLLDICSIISSLDMALHANTWKFAIKQCVKHQSLVEEHLRHDDIISCLCDDLLGSLSSCLELAEQITQQGLQPHSPEVKLFQKSTKMCRFFANTLVHYVKEFKDFLFSCSPRFHLLLLQIHSKFPPCLGAPSLTPALTEELRGAVLVAMDALLAQLLNFRPFVETILAEKQSFSGDTALAHCLLLVSVLAQLPSQPQGTLQLWCDGKRYSEETPRLSVFEAVFQSFGRCVLERVWPVRLPGVMLHGQAQSSVSLHQHVCVHLCGCVAALPAPQLPPLERSLLCALLQSDVQTALLATDVWCFLARYGTAELCLHHVLLVVELIKSCPGETPQWNHLSLLLRRMLFLMTPTHQMELLERFPGSMEENACLWGHVLLRSLAPEVRSRLEQELTAMAASVTQDWQQGGCKLGTVDRLNKVLWALRVVVRVEVPEAACTSSVLSILAQLWPRMCAEQVERYRPLRQTLCLLLSLSAGLAKSLEPKTISQAISCLSALLPLTALDDVTLAALEFLAAMGSVFIPPDIQPVVLPRLSAAFGSLLSADSWLLLQHALEAFGIFAEVTNHEEVISQGLTSEESRTRVVNFLSKTVVGMEEHTEARLERLRAEAHTLETHTRALESGQEPPRAITHTPATVTVTPAQGAEEQQELTHTTATTTESQDDSQKSTTLEPCPKRVCQESPGWEEAEGHLQAAEAALKAIQALGGAPPSTDPHSSSSSSSSSSSPLQPPHWLLTRLHQLQTLITLITKQGDQDTSS
ncbi:FIGNL1-interacting regulator of recombination and mitosis [Engraulis encrasicolus]|uniref:FIGNL1-interacting regulator of recombination and mitosis n=1 Tax=Engraulis encrasicolus TaxID=184585 RepID=UPI002FD40D0A